MWEELVEVWVRGASISVRWAGERFVEVASYLWDPQQRLYWLYILVSFAVALGVYAVRSRRDSLPGGALAFVFPPYIWRHRSTWVDIRYLIPHQMIRLTIYGALGVSVSALVSTGAQGLLEWWWGVTPDVRELEYLGVVIYTVLLAIALDFAAFGMHWLQHHVPALWAFHRVHHSSEVLNPLSNYREHPVDNLFYAISASLVYGLFVGLSRGRMGIEPTKWTILGVAVPFFLFNLAGYHLRHSHVWLRWPGSLAVCFGCPAHHQIHHSLLPEHRNKNLAFMLPVWDVLFGTFCLPDEEPEFTVGLGDGTEGEYHSFWSLYTRPLKDFRRAVYGGQATR